ncbi:MAG: ABC transporter ATP-binding protein [Candidatus Poribacteria bacterium]|nr:MAG: ABC transporter ATP-binding protein [Candidatus Poribacteria bacterium]
MVQSHPNDEVIRLEGVTKVYRMGEVEVPALRGVDLVVRRGEFAALAGPSGSGKTTLLNLIGGLDVPTEGRVLLAGRPLDQMSGRELSDFRRDHIGFIFQAYNLIPVLSAYENVEYVLLLQRVPEVERRKRVLEILEAVGLKGMEHRRPAQLSGGQQQRVAVARAMVTRPDLILADEPTANLDSATGEALLDMMRSLNQQYGMTFLFSTHDPMIMERARRLILLRDGRVVQDERRG